MLPPKAKTSSYTSATSDPEGTDSEEKIFSLLFGECDKHKTGLVDIKDLIDYIRRMQLQVPRSEGEDPVIDSQDSVSCSELCWKFMLYLSKNN